MCTFFHTINYLGKEKCQKSHKHWSLVTELVFLSTWSVKADFRERTFTSSSCKQRIACSQTLPVRGSGTETRGYVARPSLCGGPVLRLEAVYPDLPCARVRYWDWWLFTHRLHLCVSVQVGTASRPWPMSAQLLLDCLHCIGWPRHGAFEDGCQNL